MGDSAYYEDRLRGIELKRYTVPEFIAIVEGYFTSIAIRRIQNPRSKSIGHGIPMLEKFDMNGKYAGRQDFPNRSMSVPRPY
jgi:hypothetical protein